MLFYALIFNVVSAQIPPDEHLKGNTMDSLWRVYVYNADRREGIENNVLNQYHKFGEKELLAFIEVLKFAKLKGADPTLAEKFRGQIESNYKGFPNVQARAYQILGYHHFIGTLNYEKAFDAYLHLEKLLEVYGPTAITDYANYCSEIAAAYYKFKNYKKAIEINKKGAKYAHDKWDFYNTIGLCYGELALPDSSIHYLQKAIKEAISKKKSDIYRTISLGNIGYSYYRQKKFNLAKPLLKIDLEGALRIDDKGLAVGAAIPLADIYLSEKKWNAADTLLKMSRSYIGKSNQIERLERLFPILSKYYQLSGNNQLALAYRDSTIRAIKRNDSVFNGLLVMRVQQRTDMGKLVEEKNKLESYRKVATIRLWTICIIFILITAVFFIVRRYRSRLKEEKKHIEELNRMLNLRQRLSADMHDDVGSTLSSISLYTHSLLLQAKSETQEVILKKIKQNAQHVQESMSDIIWSVNPEMDSMVQTVARMRTFGADMTEYCGIVFAFIYDNEVAELQIEMAARRGLYLIYKEAINNAIKYSCCKHINITLSLSTDKLVMEIVDDGIGFDTERKHSGNGLMNMQRRAEEISGQLQITSTSQTGTALKLILPLING